MSSLDRFKEDLERWTNRISLSPQPVPFYELGGIPVMPEPLPEPTIDDDIREYVQKIRRSGGL